ncbi:MAG: alpha/beta hydrolase [Lachnospiraceae bacterium]|nr:alpha/beta hydrolase [Lachnospiraceae bacterium]
MIENLQKHEDRTLVPHGTLYFFETEMVPYPDHRRRTIRVWLPEEYDGVRRFPVIYLHDGQNVFQNPEGRRVIEADRAVTSLADEGISAIIVAIDNGSALRSTELTPPYPSSGLNPLGGAFAKELSQSSTGDVYAEFITKHLKPMIDTEFATLSDPLNTCVGGVSAGGSASYYLFMHYPEVFGKAFVDSPGFPLLSKEALMDELENYDYSRLADHRICFYNGDQGLESTSLYYVIDVYRKLKEKGLDATQNMVLVDSRQTHYQAPWAKYLPEMLRFLFAEDNRAEFPPQRPR